MLRNKKVVITGASQGMGCVIAKKFCENDYQVVGIDIKPQPSELRYSNYTHFICDVANKVDLPDISNVGILINCAGTANDSTSIRINLIGNIYACEKYALQPEIESVLNIVSVSAHNGAEYPHYTASKGGLLAYTKWLAQELAQYRATVNSISPGGVISPMTEHIWQNAKKRELVLNENLFGKWATCEEIAEWAYFFTVVNKSCTGQDIIIDNGETSKYNFIQ